MDEEEDDDDREIESLRAKMQSIHDSGVNLKAEWRIDQLRRLERMIRENEDAIRAALYADLGKEWTEATCSEICTLQEEIALCLRHVRSWMKPRVVASPGISFPARSKVVPMPLSHPGVFIMGPSNYPFSLCLHPAIGSLAAGNPTLVKPSELCPATCQLLQRLIPQYFGGGDTTTHAAAGLQVILSENIAKTTKLLSRPWGCIFFTGSARVGRIVATAAAQTLTKVILELGGKTPCIVDETCPSSSSLSWSPGEQQQQQQQQQNNPSLQQIAHRIVWAKLFNAGQSCAAVDYVVVHESVAPALVQCLQKAIRTQFPGDIPRSELGRIVCREHAQRHLELLQQVEQQSSAKFVFGGSKDCDVASRYIAPTIVVNPPEDCRLMKEEIFGPILPVITVTSRQEAIDTVHRVSGMAPLCLYVFTKLDSVLQEYIAKCRAGGVVRNDCLVHLASHELPFGGLGTSGYGQYHGKYSFDAFSQSLPVVYRPVALGMDACMARFHPMAGIKGKVVANVLMKMPYVPVLLKPAIVVTAVLAAVMTRLVTRKHGGFLQFVASALEELAEWIRQQTKEQ